MSMPVNDQIVEAAISNRFGQFRIVHGTDLPSCYPDLSQIVMDLSNGLKSIVNTDPLPIVIPKDANGSAI